MKYYNPTYKQRKEMERIIKNIPPYHYNHTPEEKKYFDFKVSTMVALGFTWSESAGTFSTDRISVYWEQVCRWNEKDFIESFRWICGTMYSEPIIDATSSY